MIEAGAQHGKVSNPDAMPPLLGLPAAIILLAGREGLSMYKLDLQSAKEVFHRCV